MKKQLTAVLLMFVLLLTMAGCSAANAIQRLDAAEDRVEEKLDAVEDQIEGKLEAALRETVSPAAPAVKPTVPAVEPAAPAVKPTVPAVEPAVPTPEPTVSAATESPRQLTQEQAQQIALDYLGLTADQVTRLRTEYEIDDGIPQFDVQFYQGDWEHEFEIHAENGKIFSYDKDHKYD